jgi:transcriptional regulator with XRE-family HTH domain
MRIYLSPSLGASIRATRRQKGLTQERLAHDAGVSLRHLVAVEQGANISVGLLLKLATYLGIRELEVGQVTLTFRQDPPGAAVPSEPPTLRSAAGIELADKTENETAAVRRPPGRQRLGRAGKRRRT